MPNLTPERFREMMAAHNVALPLAPVTGNEAVVIDDNGNDVLVADPDGWRSDAEATAISALIAAAVNAAAGFPPTPAIALSLEAAGDHHTPHKITEKIIQNGDTTGGPPAVPDPECCSPRLPKGDSDADS
jgi:hypothetical protein